MNLGDRMKGYENISKNCLMKRTPVIIRLDGKAFHTFTRGLDKPFDKEFVEIMQNTMLELCENIQGCVLGYTQSDEITLVLIDYKELDSCAWFDNEIQKIVSVSSSMATLYFNKWLRIQINKLWDEYAKTFQKIKVPTGYVDDDGDDDYFEKIIGDENINKKRELLLKKEFQATFDSRAFNVPKEEVCNNLIWRQQDATRNSINALAQSLFSHKELQGIGCKDVQNKMLVEKDTNWNNLSTTLKRGSCAIKSEDGKWFIDNEIPIFTEDREYIDKRVLI